MSQISSLEHGLVTQLTGIYKVITKFKLNGLCSREFAIVPMWVDVQCGVGDGWRGVQADRGERRGGAPGIRGVCYRPGTCGRRRHGTVHAAVVKLSQSRQTGVLLLVLVVVVVVVGVMVVGMTRGRP